MTGPADELRTALPGEDLLTRRSRTALEHYEHQAQAARREAAIARARAFHLDDDARLTLARSADALDAQAAQWEALATELRAFAEQQTPDHGETLL